jgi:hypothetical protein
LPTLERKSIVLTPTRRRLAAVATVLLVPLLAGCGFGYQTDQVYQPGVGVNNRVGSVDILAAVVVNSAAGEGTFVASLVNKDTKNDDTLVSVTGDDLDVQLAAPVKIASDTLVNLADAGAVSVQGKTIAPGEFARLTLTFESGQKTEINAPVVPYKDEYNEVRLASPQSTPAP